MNLLAKFCDWLNCKEPRIKTVREKRTNFITQETKEGREIFTLTPKFAKGENVVFELANVKIIDIVLEKDNGFRFKYLVEFQEDCYLNGERKWVEEYSLEKYKEVSVE